MNLFKKSIYNSRENKNTYLQLSLPQKHNCLKVIAAIT